MSEWFTEANRAASARGLDRPEFANIIPTYLSSLGTAADQLGRGPIVARKHVESHASTRLRQGFSVSELVDDFGILGRAILRRWVAVPEAERPDAADLDRLFTELNHAISAVIGIYHQHLLEDEQTDKRYRRLLQQIASEALAPQAPSFKQRLSEVLELIMEAMGAQSTALLLSDAGSQRLVQAAAVGLGAGTLQRYATMDVGSFAAHVATSGEETSSILDVEVTPLSVSEELRTSGIHSLLGVRLPPHHALLGVLYVGLSATREFTAREVRRIESLGAQLTMHLDNAKLYAMLREKVAALELERGLREHFVSVLAHDLRGPLSAAKLTAHQLIGHPERLEQRRDLAFRIERNIDRTDQMVRDLLDANRIRAGERLPLRLEECDLGGIVREVIEELASTHGERFVMQVPEHVRGMWSAEELRRALWNLGTNAAKYGAPDSPVLFVVTRSGDSVTVSVHNVGVPIPEEDQKELFRPFARTRAAMAGNVKGWGLGLTLVRGAAEAHGGTISVESSAKAGTTFTLVLPLDARPFQQAPEHAAGMQS